MSCLLFLLLRNILPETLPKPCLLLSPVFSPTALLSPSITILYHCRQNHSSYHSYNHNHNDNCDCFFYSFIIKIHISSFLSMRYAFIFYPLFLCFATIFPTICQTVDQTDSCILRKRISFQIIKQNCFL